MSTTAEIRLHTTRFPDRTLMYALTRIVDALQVTEESELSFRGVRVYTENNLKPALHIPEALDAEALYRTLSPWDSPTSSFSVRTAITRYTSDVDSHIEPALMPIWVRVRGGQWPGRSGEWWIDGDTHLIIDPAAAYTFPTSPNGEVCRCNAIAANIKNLIQLLAAVIERLEPVAAKLYTDSGETFPFNAHLAYYTQPEDVIRDARLIHELFTVGQQVLELPPLREAHGDLADFVFHLWRDRQQQQLLRERFSRATESVFVPARDEAIRKLTDAASSQTPIGSGYVIYDATAPFNSFLDDFYLQLLEISHPV